MHSNLVSGVRLKWLLGVALAVGAIALSVVFIAGTNSSTARAATAPTAHSAALTRAQEVAVLKNWALDARKAVGDLATAVQSKKVFKIIGALKAAHTVFSRINPTSLSGTLDKLGLPHLKADLGKAQSLISFIVKNGFSFKTLRGLIDQVANANVAVERVALDVSEAEAVAITP